MNEEINVAYVLTEEVLGFDGAIDIQFLEELQHTHSIGVMMEREILMMMKI